MGNRITSYNVCYTKLLRFRVASVSKLLTAVAVMKLVEDRKLHLDDQVFGPKGIIKDAIFDKVKDKNLYKITVRQLFVITSYSIHYTKLYDDRI